MRQNGLLWSARERLERLNACWSPACAACKTARRSFRKTHVMHPYLYIKRATRQSNARITVAAFHPLRSGDCPFASAAPKPAAAAPARAPLHRGRGCSCFMPLVQPEAEEGSLRDSGACDFTAPHIANLPSYTKG